MKTPEQVFMKVQKIECPRLNNFTLPEDWQIKAMEVYAEQFKKDIEALKLNNAVLRKIIDGMGLNVITSHDGSNLTK